jgi:hypothetical protein
VEEAAAAAVGGEKKKSERETAKSQAEGAAASGDGAWDQVGGDKELGVSYDLLTSLSERMSDLSMFDEAQIEEEGLASCFTSGELEERYIGMCSRLAQRISQVEGASSGGAPITTLDSLLKWTRGRDGLASAWGQSGLSRPAARFFCLEFMVSELQTAQMLALAAPAQKKKGDEKSQQKQMATGETSSGGGSAVSCGGGGGGASFYIEAIARACGTDSSLGAVSVLQTAYDHVEKSVESGKIVLDSPVMEVGSLGEDGMQEIAYLSQELRQEYSLRKQMLLDR